MMNSEEYTLSPNTYREIKERDPHHMLHCKNLSKLVANVVLDTAPMIVSFFSPLTKIMMVGMLLTPYFPGVAGDSSVFSLKNFSFPVYCCASSLTMGSIILQGPHHGAQKSTTTGSSALSTRDSHVESFTIGTATTE